MTFVSLRHAHWGQVIITWQVKISSQILWRLLRYQNIFFTNLLHKILNLSQILYLFFNCDTFSYCLQNHTHYPLSDLQPEILRLLSCNHGNTSSCQQSLSQLIGLLSYDDLDSLLTQHIEVGGDSYYIVRVQWINSLYHRWAHPFSVLLML